MYSNKMKDDEEEVETGSTESPLQEGQSRIAEPRGESSNAADTALEVEIEVPRTEVPMSDMSDNSVVSTLSESRFVAATKSPACYHGLDSAGNTGLGIAQPNHYQYRGDNCLITLGFAGEQWHPKNWEIYKNSTMASP